MIVFDVWPGAKDSTPVLASLKVSYFAPFKYNASVKADERLTEFHE
jgi:hypothetical protein